MRKLSLILGAAAVLAAVALPGRSATNEELVAAIRGLSGIQSAKAARVAHFIERTFPDYPDEPTAETIQAARNAFMALAEQRRGIVARAVQRSLDSAVEQAAAEPAWSALEGPLAGRGEVTQAQLEAFLNKGYRVVYVDYSDGNAQLVHSAARPGTHYTAEALAVPIKRTRHLLPGSDLESKGFGAMLQEVLRAHGVLASGGTLAGAEETDRRDEEADATTAAVFENRDAITALGGKFQNFSADALGRAFDNSEQARGLVGADRDTARAAYIASFDPQIIEREVEGQPGKFQAYLAFRSRNGDTQSPPMVPVSEEMIDPDPDKADDALRRAAFQLAGVRMETGTEAGPIDRVAPAVGQLVDDPTSLAQRGLSEGAPLGPPALAMSPGDKVEKEEKFAEQEADIEADRSNFRRSHTAWLNARNEAIQRDFDKRERDLRESDEWRFLSPTDRTNRINALRQEEEQAYAAARTEAERRWELTDHRTSERLAENQRERSEVLEATRREMRRQMTLHMNRLAEPGSQGARDKILDGFPAGRASQYKTEVWEAGTNADTIFGEYWEANRDRGVGNDTDMQEPTDFLNGKIRQWWRTLSASFAEADPGQERQRARPNATPLGQGLSEGGE